MAASWRCGTHSSLRRSPTPGRRSHGRAQHGDHRRDRRHTRSATVLGASRRRMFSTSGCTVRAAAHTPMCRPRMSARDVVMQHARRLFASPPSSQVIDSNNGNSVRCTHAKRVKPTHLSIALSLALAAAAVSSNAATGERTEFVGRCEFDRMCDDARVPMVGDARVSCVERVCESPCVACSGRPAGRHFRSNSFFFLRYTDNRLSYANRGEKESIREREDSTAQYAPDRNDTDTHDQW